MPTLQQLQAYANDVNRLHLKLESLANFCDRPSILAEVSQPDANDLFQRVRSSAGYLPIEVVPSWIANFSSLKAVLEDRISTLAGLEEIREAILLLIDELQDSLESARTPNSKFHPVAAISPTAGHKWLSGVQIREAWEWIARWWFGDGGA